MSLQIFLTKQTTIREYIGGEAITDHQATNETVLTVLYDYVNFCSPEGVINLSTFSAL